MIDFTMAILLLGAAVILFGFVKVLKTNLYRKPVLIINKAGISISTKNISIEWLNIVDTYIKTKSRENSDDETLLIHHYNNFSKKVEIVELTLYNLKEKPALIAYAIELIKSKQHN